MADTAVMNEHQLKERVSVLEAENAMLLAQIAELTKNIALCGNDLQKSITDLTQANFKLQRELREAEARERKQAHLLFAISRDKKKKTASRFTVQRDMMKQEELRVMKEEIAKWMTGILKMDFAPTTLIDVLTTGVILCDLLKIIDPSLQHVMGRVHERAGPGSFLAHDNLKAFLRGCTQLGVPIHNLFDTSALAKQNQETRSWKEERSVLYCLLSVSRCATKFGFDPPDIVRLEQEIEAIRSKAKGFESALPSAGHKQGGTAEEIDQHVQLCSKELGLPHPPARLRPGEYQFNEETIAHVRIVRGVALVRFQNNWTELAPFMAQIAETPVRDVRIATVEGHANGEGNGKEGNTKGKSAKVGFVDEEPDMMIDSLDDEDDSKGDSEGSTEKHVGRTRLKVHQDEAKKEFFYLTALAVKLNHNLREDVCLVDTTDLWEKACLEGVDFYKFGSWVEKELTKIYLEAARRDRMNYIARRESQTPNQPHSKAPHVVDGEPLAVPTEIPVRGHGQIQGLSPTNEPITSTSTPTSASASSSVSSKPSSQSHTPNNTSPRQSSGSTSPTSNTAAGSGSGSGVSEDLRRHRSTVTKNLNKRKEQAIKDKLSDPLDK